MLCATISWTQACVDWTLEQLPALEIRINEWLKLNVTIEIEDPDQNVPNNVIVAVQRSELPQSFNVEIGAYLNTIRSSLDLLTTTLFIRYDIGNPEDAYFPIARTRGAFVGSRRASQFLDGLPPADRARIEALEPYGGGNDDLWSLHQLDIMRKHRRLLTMIAEPEFFSVEGVGIHQHFAPVATGFMRADNVSERKVVLGLMAKNAPPYGMRFSPYVAFDESAITGRKRVVRALHEFAELARSIIRLFDY